MCMAIFINTFCPIAQIVIPEELREKMRKSEDELAHKLGYY